MRGGKRQGAGRKRGSKTQKTRSLAVKAAALGVSPLEYMLGVMRAPEPARAEDEDSASFLARLLKHKDLAFEAAKSAAPYVHPRLQAVEHTGKNGGPIVGASLDMAKLTDEQVRALASISIPAE